MNLPRILISVKPSYSVSPAMCMNVGGSDNVITDVSWGRGVLGTRFKNQ